MRFPNLGEGFHITRVLEKMSMQKLVALAAVASLFSAGFIYLLVSGFTQEEKPVSSMVTVVMAKEDIPQRTLVRESMLKTVQLPVELVPDGAVTDENSIVGKPARVPIMAGDVLTDKKVLTDPRMAGFIGAIPPDCRAISIGISDITGIAGFAKAGDYVDVMVITDKKDKNTISGEILLQNVLLLAVNKTGDAAASSSQNNSADNKDNTKDNKDNKNSKDNKDDTKNQASKDNTTLATLAVTPEEALRLAVASKQGTIYLVLRPFKPKDMFVLDTEYSITLAGDTVAPPPSLAANTNPAVEPSAPPLSVAAPVPSSASAPAPESDFGIKIIRGGGKNNGK